MPHQHLSGVAVPFSGLIMLPYGCGRPRTAVRIFIGFCVDVLGAFPGSGSGLPGMMPHYHYDLNAKQKPS